MKGEISGQFGNSILDGRGIFVFSEDHFFRDLEKCGTSWNPPQNADSHPCTPQNVIVNLWKRDCKKLRSIILLHFGPVTFDLLMRETETSKFHDFGISGSGGLFRPLPYTPCLPITNLVSGNDTQASNHLVSGTDIWVSANTETKLGFQKPFHVNN